MYVLPDESDVRKITFELDEKEGAWYISIKYYNYKTRSRSKVMYRFKPVR